MRNRKKAIIIGAGFGSLSLAIRLLGKGWSVDIYEKSSYAGGHAGKIEDAGYTFDTGPSLITAPEILKNTFASADLELSDYIDLIALNPYYRVIYHDNTYIDYNGNIDDMQEQIARFNKQDAANYLKYLDYSKKIYEAIIVDGLGATPFNRLSTMLKFIPKAIKLNALANSYKMAKRFFNDFRTRFIFSFHPLFIGGNPFKVPSIYQMIPYLEKEQGVWYTKGGMSSLVAAFTKAINDLGGMIHLNSEVDEIIINHRKATGIRIDNDVKQADIVISNADITHTYKDLINNGLSWNNRKVARKKYAMSAFIVYLGVRKKFDKIKHHTLALSDRYENLVNDIFINNILPEDFSLYLHVPSRTDPTMAPEGCESIYALAPVTNLSTEINWDLIKDEFANRIIDRLENHFGLDGLRRNIEVMHIVTPYDFKQLKNSYLGSPWGLEPILLQSAYFRPYNKDKNIHDLFIVGAGTHPGAGLPGVMLSAEATMSEIKNKYGD